MGDLRMLVSDLDGTLIGSDRGHAAALARFRDFVRAHGDLTLAYVTGRAFAHAVDGIGAAGLPWPDHLGTSVGTELRANTGSRENPRWEFDRSFHDRLAARVGAHPLQQADSIVLAHRGTRLQPAEQQSDLKRSFFVEAAVDLGALTDALMEELQSAGFGCTPMQSVDPATGQGLLDLLPEGVSKATAIDVLRERNAFEPETIVFAGDSGNDIAGLKGRWHGILVGNAPEELREALRSSGRDPAWPRVVLAEGHVIEGVLEGLAELGWLRD